MGRYEKYFCMSVPATLILSGTILSLLSVFASFYDFIILFTMFDKRQEGEEDHPLMPVIAITTIIFMFIYVVNAALQCSLCCKTCYNNPPRYFKFYIIIASFVALCALTDGILKFMVLPVASIFLFIFFLAIVFNIVIAFLARIELQELQIKELRDFNAGEGGQIVAGKEDFFPKYAMAVQVEKVDAGGSTGRDPEAEPLNKNNY